LNFISSSAQDSAKNIILVGNKTDLEGNRKVSFEEAVQLAKRLNLAAVFETSAKDGKQVDDVFFRGVVNCMDYFQSMGGLNSHVIPRKNSEQHSITKSHSFFTYKDEDEQGLTQYRNVRPLQS